MKKLHNTFRALIFYKAFYVQYGVLCAVVNLGGHAGGGCLVDHFGVKNLIFFDDGKVEADIFEFFSLPVERVTGYPDYLTLDFVYDS